MRVIKGLCDAWAIFFYFFRIMPHTSEKPLFIANWKMNLTAEETKRLLSDIMKDCQLSPSVETVVCPSFTSLPLASRMTEKSPLILGAQDVSWLEKGSLTGEVSPLMLKEYGVRYVLVGHSERRQFLMETDDMVNAKVRSCLAHDLVPVVCVGETFEQRQEGKKDHTVFSQVRAALRGIDLEGDGRIVIAYEPVWVIGSGQAVNTDEALRSAEVAVYAAREQFSRAVVDEKVDILYGGSVDSGNIKSFLKHPISGVLVGGASLQKSEFCEMIKTLSTSH